MSSYIPIATPLGVREYANFVVIEIVTNNVFNGVGDKEHKFRLTNVYADLLNNIKIALFNGFIKLQKFLKVKLNLHFGSFEELS